MEDIIGLCDFLSVICLCDIRFDTVESQTKSRFVKQIANRNNFILAAYFGRFQDARGLSNLGMHKMLSYIGFQFVLSMSGTKASKVSQSLNSVPTTSLHTHAIFGPDSHPFTPQHPN